MTINKELLVKTLAFIKANPETWDQGDWVCGTTMCFAGHACVLNGDKLITDPDDDWQGCVQGVTDPHDGDPMHASERARLILGLDHVDSKRLFHAGNSLERLDEIVAELCR